MTLPDGEPIPFAGWVKEEFKAGDFVQFKDQNKSPFVYMVVNPVVDNAPPNLGGMTLVARWYRTDLLEKAQEKC